MRQPPTGTVTFLFTDIEGSTRLWDSSPEAMRLALARHDQLLRQTVTDSGGFVFKTVGDAFCAAFATARDALAGALAAQLALCVVSWDLPTPLRVRMALHTGSAEERDGDYFGPPLNRVARLMAAGHGGQTLLSLAAQELVRDQLPAKAALRDLGEASLKDLSRPERVFQLLHPSLPADFPPLRSLDHPSLPNNLPQQLTSFIGREKEVAEVKALLDRTRLLTLTGPGGSGKTRLSLQVAADLLDGEGDGAWLAELAALSDPALVPQAVAQVLGVREAAGKTVSQALVEWLKPKRLLLILDNCEHLVAACATLTADLLRHCPGVHILASSREALNVAGEQAYPVPSLSLPDPKRAQTVESLSQYEAVILFIERAQAVRPGFAVTDANAPAVAQVCFHLDGIPLAIELAAARVRSLSAEEINARLDQRFRLLTGGARDTLPRQQTLRALIDWSYDLLTGQEKTLLGRLSVFAGGWTLEAAEAVCAGESGDGSDDIEAWEVLDGLTALADKSLVVAETEAGGTRYRLLETVRQYAGERLREADGRDAAQGRHTAHFLALAVASGPELSGPDQKRWLERLEVEHDNLRAALDWCAARPEEAETGLKLAAALGRFWGIHGHLTEGRTRLRTALARAQDAAPALRASALYEAGSIAGHQGDHAETRRLLAECLAIRRGIGDRAGCAGPLRMLGIEARERGDYDAARAFLTESRSLYQESGDRRGQTGAITSLGNLAMVDGDLETAYELYAQSLPLYREYGDRRGEAVALGNLGNVAGARGEHARAQGLFGECLDIYTELGDLRGAAITRHSQAVTAIKIGDDASAIGLLRECLAAYQGLGDRQGGLDVLGVLATALTRTGRGVAAVRLWAAADALGRQIGAAPTRQDGDEWNQETKRTRLALGEVAFAAAWAAGQTLSWEQAVEYALQPEEG